MDRFKIYEGVSDVDGKFSMEFRRYIRDEKLLCQYSTNRLWFPIWLFNKEQQLDGVDSSYLDFLNKLKQLALYHDLFGLVQFWKAEEEVTAVGEKHFVLTTRNQPFLISKFDAALVDPKMFTYRMKMEDIVIKDAGEGGVVGRVFWNKRPEFSPNIGYYSYEEYPYRDLALSCDIESSSVLPLKDSSGRLTGVVEIVSQYNSLGFHNLQLQHLNGLRYFDCWKDTHQPSNLHEGSFRVAVSEIKEVMIAVGRSLNLVCAQTWMLSNDCECILTSNKIDYKADTSYGFNSRMRNFILVEYEFTLKKAEGVVGKAATSVHNLVYCDDVSKFCITEYPLAHFAREYGLKSSFAICLRSNLTGSQIYILEFFLNANEFNGSNLRAILVPILEIMRQSFQTFKVASGDEIGDSLFVLVIDAHSPDKTATLINRELDLRLAIGINNIEGRLPYNVPYSIGESSTHETDDTMDGPESSFNETSTQDTTLVSASTVQSELHVTVNASFRGDFFIFQLSSSSGIHGLSQQLSRRLNLEIGTYTVAYQDEDNDWILVVCDEDLHHYILSLMQQGKYTLKIMIEPKQEL